MFSAKTLKNNVSLRSCSEDSRLYLAIMLSVLRNSFRNLSTWMRVVSTLAGRSPRNESRSRSRMGNRTPLLNSGSWSRSIPFFGTRYGFGTGPDSPLGPAHAAAEYPSGSYSDALLTTLRTCCRPAGTRPQAGSALARATIPDLVASISAMNSGPVSQEDGSRLWMVVVHVNSTHYKLEIYTIIDRMMALHTGWWRCGAG
jgi:hypothetical protein